MPRFLLALLLLTQATCAVAAEFSDPAVNVGRVFSLMDERLRVMRQVAAWKWTHDLPVYDAAREQRVLDDSVSHARAMGLNADGVRQLFGLQIEWARTLQQRYFDEWRAHGFDKSQVLDLNAVIRPKLDRIGQELLQAIYVSASDRQSSARSAEIGRWAAQLADEFDLGHESAASITGALAAIRVAMAPAYDRIHAAGVLKIGTTGDYAPFSLDRNGYLEGLDIVLAERLAQALGARAVFVKTSWSTLTEDLQAGEFDIAMSGITVTPARERVALFSVPYQPGGKTAIVRCADVSRFDSLEKIDAPNVRVIVNPGGTNEQFVREHVHRARVHVHPDNRTVFEEIIANRADAMLTDDIEVQLQTHLHPELCAAFAKPLTQAAKAIMLQRDTSLQNTVNEWLSGELEQGEVRRELERAINPSTEARKHGR